MLGNIEQPKMLTPIPNAGIDPKFQVSPQFDGQSPIGVSSECVMNNGLRLVKSLEFPEVDPGTEWRSYLSDCSPLAGRLGRRNSYADWLGGEIANQKGLYIWLHTLSEGEPQSYRFVHVGLSKRARSTLASRIRAHCRNAFCIDPVYQLVGTQNRGAGHLEKICERCANPGDENAAKHFLDQMRILMIIPTRGDDDQVANLSAGAEGLVAYAAALALGEKRITNTLRAALELGEEEITNTLSKVLKPEQGTPWGSFARRPPVIPGPRLRGVDTRT